LPQSAPVAVFLLLALLLAGVLASQAISAARYHRATAERVLKDYAAFAVRSYAMRAANQVYYYGIYPAAQALAAVPERPGPLPSPESLRRGADRNLQQALGLVSYFFRYNLKRRSLSTGTDAPPATVAWLDRTLGGGTVPWYDTTQGFGSLSVSGEDPARFFFMVESDSSRRPTTILGIATTTDRLAPNFRLALFGPPLLPPTLTGGVIFDSLASVQVADHGRVIFASDPQYPPTFSAHDTLGARFGVITLDLALRPAIAEKLIIGGLPRSRLPLLLGLLLLTAGLMGAALLQLRREYQLAQLRTEFVASVSHELRTPLAQIRMFTETMLLDRIRSEEERRRSLQIVDQEARRLTHLVENLLHLSRSERGLERITREPVDLVDLVRGVASDFEPLTRGRQVRLRLDLPAPVTAAVDAGAARQVLLNLLDNALKYGPAGQTVTIGLLAEDGRVRLQVDDQGPGVPPADRERVWERFWRADEHRNSAVTGTGIGLAVVRELSALHDGGAWVEAAPGGGARFVVEFRSDSAQVKGE
jgi:signal transduction histidine kinase